jgi:hypothetical protein
MGYGHSDVKNLLSDARQAETLEELQAIVERLDEAVTDIIDDVEYRVAQDFDHKANDLAGAICAFAEWQKNGYKDRDESTYRAIGRHLWLEVSDCVHAITGRRPEEELPRPSAQNLNAARS